MTTAFPVGASLTGQWQSIDWKTAHKHVRRLQMRIAKASRERRWGKVNALQRLLTRSFYAKALAVKHITETSGSRTPGVDGVVWKTPAQKMQGVLSLNHRGYRAEPLKRVYIPKRDKASGKRPLSIPTIADRAMQRLHALALEPVAEMTADPNSYGFRPHRSTADAIGQCFTVLARKDAAAWILEGDIRACFDTISHQWLGQNIPMDGKILCTWLKAGYIDKSVYYRTEEGAPQGSPISPIVANMTLDGLEDALTRVVSRRDKVHVVRYCDDFIVTGATRAILEQKVKPALKSFLALRGLELSERKTKITHIKDGFDFLGFNLRKYSNDKLLVKPSKESVKTFLRQIRTEIKANLALETEYLIWHLNRKIRGWANYYRHCVAKHTFQYVDMRIFRMLWRWAKRRHPNKNAHWVKEKYFRTQGTRNWVFSARSRDREDDPIWVNLFYAAQMPIRRHVKIRAKATPYDPAYKVYFERRVRRTGFGGNQAGVPD